MRGETNIPQKIWEILGKHPAIQKDIARNIINTRALANYLIKRYGLNASLDAVISAIRRYQTDKKYEEYNTSVENILSGGNVLTNSNMACLTALKNQDTIKLISGLYDALGAKHEIKIVNSGKHIKLIGNISIITEIKQQLLEKDVIKLERDMGEVIIKTSMQAEYTKGVVARMLNEILVHDINVHEIIVCLPDITLLVKQQDLLIAHDSLLKLCHRGLGNE